MIRVENSTIKLTISGLSQLALDLPSRPASDSLSSYLSPARQESAEETKAQYFAQAESDFESDSGDTPIGEYSDSLSETLQAVNGVDVRAMDCRNSICRVTYSKSESLSPEELADIDAELIDKMAFGVEGHNVDLTHASDEYGNKIVYIQLR